MHRTLLSLMIASLGVGLSSGAFASAHGDGTLASPSTIATQTPNAKPSLNPVETTNEGRLNAVVEGLSKTSEAPQSSDSDEASAPDEGIEANTMKSPATADDEVKLSEATTVLDEQADDETSDDLSDDKALRRADSVSPLAIVPPFLDFMPYVTSLKDVEEVFGQSARLYEDGRFGKRHIITGQDFDLGVTSILVYYTDQGLLSDVFLRIPSERRPQVLEQLKKMADDMSPDGLWSKEGDRDIWRTKTAELVIGAAKGKDFSVEYGATARQVRETRAWIEADPEHRAPRFAGLTIGISTAKDIQAKADGKRCRILGPSLQKDGSNTYALTGKCFGIPGEYQSLAWLAADNGRLTRLFIQSRGDEVGFASVLPALQKRYKPTLREGEFEVGDAPARNIWLPTIRVTPYKKTADGTQDEGTLEFYAGIDGVKKAEAKWDQLLEEKKAREAQAKAVDQLFE